MNEAILRSMARLLIALARMAIEHDRGYASQKTWHGVNDAIKELDGEIKR